MMKLIIPTNRIYTIGTIIFIILYALPLFAYFKIVKKNKNKKRNTIIFAVLWAIVLFSIYLIALPILREKIMWVKDINYGY